MSRLNFDLIRAEEELAGARQCITCLCGATLTASGMALLFKFDAMPAWGMAASGALLFLFLVTGTLFAFLPAFRERRLRRRRLRYAPLPPPQTHVPGVRRRAILQGAGSRMGCHGNGGCAQAGSSCRTADVTGCTAAEVAREEEAVQAADAVR